MAYFTLETFKYGLDGRKSDLTSGPGTLVQLENGHVTQGGEVEKRKAFVRTALPAGCFGLEASDKGLVTFGSGADPGGWPRGKVSYYQQLQHPAVGVLSVSYNAAWHAMTAIVDSQPYLGKVLALAKFADGFTFLYYNGVPVISSYSGLWLSGYQSDMTGAISVPAPIYDIIFGFSTIPGFSAGLNYPNISYAGAGTTTNAAVYTTTGLTFSNVITVKSAAGDSLDTAAFKATAAVPGTQASASFTVNGAGGQIIDVFVPVAVSPLSPNTRQKLASVVWATSNNATATAIAAAIAATSSASGFTAAAVGAVVTIKNSTILSQPYDPTGGSLPYTYATVVVAGTSASNGSYAFVAGGMTNPATGQASAYQFDGASWARGDTFSIFLTTTSGNAVVGRGQLGDGWWTSGTVVYPPKLTVFNSQVMLANGNQFNFSSPGDPTGWEIQSTNAGFTPFTSQFGAQDSVQSFSTYQGKLAVFGQYSIQLWNWSSIPANQSRQQVLQNIGTIAPLSVNAMGGLDVMFLATTGVRSLRVRDSSLNAYINDIGSPIDDFVTPATDACSIVDPDSGRYWLHSSGTIFVLSYYPTNKIIAWSTYFPTYQNGSVQTTFTPQKFVVYQQQVFARDASAVYAYGGTAGDTYDNATCVVTTPWLAAKSPGTNKVSKGIDVVWDGAWALQVGTDWQNDTFKLVYTNANSSFDNGGVGISIQGTHFGFKATTSDTKAATLSSFLYYYQLGQEDKT